MSSEVDVFTFTAHKSNRRTGSGCRREGAVEGIPQSGDLVTMTARDSRATRITTSCWSFSSLVLTLTTPHLLHNLPTNWDFQML